MPGIRKVDLELDSSPRSAGLMADELRACLDGMEIPDEPKFDVLIACDEVFANIYHHGYSDREDGTVIVEMRVSREAVLITFIDFSDKPIPIDREKPELGEAILIREQPGIGLFLIRTLIDHIEYSREGAENRLTLKKFIRGENAAELKK